MATLYENSTWAWDGIVRSIYGSTYWYAQTFTPQVTHDITSVVLSLGRPSGDSPGTITVSIRATTAGEPSGEDLCSGTTNGNTVPEIAFPTPAPEEREITFGTNPTLTAGTKYAIVVRAPSGSSSNKLYWLAATSSVYANGDQCHSGNAGSTWTLYNTRELWFKEYGDPIPVNIQQVRMGVDGDFLMALATDGVYLSSDLGDSWAKKLPDGSGTTTWSKGTCSSDGTYCIVVSDANAIYRTANGGTNWAQITPAGGDTFSVNDLAISNDGQYVAIVGQNTTDSTKSLYLSTDYGATWVANNPIASSIEWTECDISNDGTTIAVDATGYFYVSFDSGVTWLPQGLAASAEVWECFGISGDGTRAVVANTGDNDEVFVGVKTNLYSRATWGEADLTSAGRALLDDANAAAQATTLGLGAADNVTHNSLTLTSIAAESSDVDKFLVDSTGIIKYRTGAQVLSDIGASGAGHNHDATYQPLDSDLTSIALLGSDADKMLYTTGTNVWAETALTAAGRAILDDADAAAQRTTLGLAIGTDIQAYDAGLTSLAGLSYASDSFIKVTAEDTYAIRTIAETKTDLSLNNVENTAHSTDAHTMTIDGRDVSVDGTKLDGIEALADVTATAETSHADVLVDGDFTSNGLMERTGAGAYGIKVIGTDVQAYDAGLASLAGLTYAAAAFVKMTGADTYALRTIGETADDLQGTIDHDLTANYDANKHVDHTGVSLTAGKGLSGGGDISVGRTFALDLTEMTGNVIWDDGTTDASITWTFALSGANDPVWTIGANSMDLTTGTLKQGGTQVLLVGDAPTAHTIASHSDTTGTGAELNTLTGGGDVGALHTHAAAYQPLDAELTSLAALSFVAASFVKMTGANTFALRTIGETADDLEATIDHDNLANGGAHNYAYISGNDGATDVTAAELEELTDGSATVLHSHAGVGAHAILDGSTHSDSVADGVTRGSIIYGNSTPKWDELVIGADGTFLGSDGTDLSYRTIDDLTADAAPQAAADYVMTYDTTASGHKKVLLCNLPVGGGIGYTGYIKVTDTKAQNTAGGGFTSGAWQTRDLTTEDIDTDNDCSLASNQITLSAGTYDCLISCPAFRTNRHQARLYNTTGTAVVLTGTSEYTNRAAGLVFNRSFIVGRFTIAASQALEVQHRCETTSGVDGFGVANNFTSEVYTIAEFWKVATTSDELVKIDAGATAGYIGAANNDGVLRTGAGLAYADGGDFVTLTVDVDGETLQHDGVNSDGGAFSFTTSGAVTFNQSIVAANYTAANLLTACATNAGELDFTGSSKKLDVEDNAVVSQDYTSDASPQFTGIELGHANDTTITRASAGNLNIEGNIVYRAGGTDVPIGDGGTGQSTQQAAIDALTNVSAATNEHVLTKDTASGNAIFKAAAGAGTDEKVGIDSGATAGYIGAASNDGVLRTGAGLTYTDGGDYITLAVSGTYVDRGDPAAVDWDEGDLTTDATWRDLDLSGVVPAGAIAVALRITVMDDATNKYVEFRENGNSNSKNIGIIYTQVANINNAGDLVIACDSNRVIEYNASNTTWTRIWITIKGWWI